MIRIQGLGQSLLPPGENKKLELEMKLGFEPICADMACGCPKSVFCFVSFRFKRNYQSYLIRGKETEAAFHLLAQNLC